MKWLLAAIILISTATYAQKRPASYRAYTGADKKLIFVDSFTDNRNDWLPDNRGCCTWPYIENGFYYENDTVGINAYAHSVPFDFNNNFQLEVTVKVMDARRKGVLFWGRDTVAYFDSARKSWTGFKGSYFYFGKQSIVFKNCEDKYRNRPCTDIVAKAKRPNGTNKYTIRKVNDRYYLFINEVFTKTFNYVPLTGKQIGLGGDDKARVIYTKLELVQLL